MSLQRNLFVLGMMGSGKSSVAHQLAERNGWPLVVLDELIQVLASGATIPEIFEHQGEEAFRDYESEALATVQDGRATVVDTGGGVVGREANRRELLAHPADRFFLNAPVAVLAARIGSAQGRPMLAGADTESRLRELLAEREILYREVATAVIDVTAGMSVDQVCGQIEASLAS